jgi:hypothetical protein
MWVGVGACWRRSLIFLAISSGRSFARDSKDSNLRPIQVSPSLSARASGGGRKAGIAQSENCNVVALPRLQRFRSYRVRKLLTSSGFFRPEVPTDRSSSVGWK